MFGSLQCVQASVNLRCNGEVINASGGVKLGDCLTKKCEVGEWQNPWIEHL